MLGAVFSVNNYSQFKTKYMSNYQKSTVFSNSAFYHETAGIVSPQEGMNLLEYFTAKAMQGLCVNTGRNGYNSAKDIASYSVEIAKETLILLEKEFNKQEIENV